MSIEFYNTQAGRRFYDGVLPRIADALERIADSLEEDKKPEVGGIDLVGSSSMVDDALKGLVEIANRDAAEARAKAIRADHNIDKRGNELSD